MAPVSILAGWAGGTQTIRVRVNNVGTTDTLDLYNAAGTTKLNVVAATQALRLQADWVSATADLQRHDDDDGQHRHGHDRHADQRNAAHRRRHHREHDLEPVDARDRRGRQRRLRGDHVTETGGLDRDF